MIVTPVSVTTEVPLVLPLDPMSTRGRPTVPLSAAQTLAMNELLKVAPAAGELARRFADAGFKLALVGGSVRDALLGRLSADLDFTTDARPEATKGILKKWAEAVWETGAAFGTITAKKGAQDPVTIEITTYRSDVYLDASRKPTVAFGERLEGDLHRRDFTINAMALELTTEEPTFVDPYGGLTDLTLKLIRTPAKPELSFSDDPLRMMRAARFAAQLEFEVDAPALKAIASMKERIAIVSAERIRDEFVKLLMSKSPRLGLSILVESGLAEFVVPELPKLKLEIDEHHRHKDVYEHSLIVLEQAIALEERVGGPDLTLRLAALLHDIGKPKTRAFIPGGGVSFHHHEVVGAHQTKARLKALRFDKQTIDDVSTLVELHLRFHGYGAGEWTDSAVRRYVRDAGPLLERLHVLTRSDCTTRNQKKAQALSVSYDDLESRIARLSQEEELAAMRPDLDGTAIMAILGIPPSRAVGQAYDHLLELRLENGPLGVERATEELKKWWASRA
ncbi:CCA-adding enzyme [mine drainage metagenome]|uniref:CCA-adding enzyme n=1 Tax=mine drainage metagenome TaxID=410659 RepID=A0A1J5PZI6_9ZZZZ